MALSKNLQDFRNYVPEKLAYHQFRSGNPLHDTKLDYHWEAYKNKIFKNVVQTEIWRTQWLTAVETGVKHA